MNQKIVNIFKNFFWNPSGEKNVYCFSCYPWIPDEKKAKVRSVFDIDRTETILIIRNYAPFWRSLSSGFIVTDVGFYFISEDQETRFELQWNEVKEVQYQERILYFYNYEDELIVKCYVDQIVNIDGSSDEVFSKSGKNLSVMFTKMAQSIEPEKDPSEEMDDEIAIMLRNDKYDQAIATLKDYINNDDGTYKAYWHYRLANVLFHCKSMYDEAIQTCTDGLNYCEEGSPVSVWLHYQRASAMLPLALDSEKYSDLRKECFQITLIATDQKRGDGVLVLDDSKKDFNEIDIEYCKSFLSLPYNERKILIPVKEYTDLGHGHISVIRIDKLSSEIEFPIGHPVVNQVYVGHPYLPNKYIPFENYQLELVEDKVREFCQIAQCLGATEISIDTENSYQSNGTRNYTQDINGSVDYKAASVNGGRKRSGGRSLIEEISQAINLHQTFNPTKAPYLPEKTVWYQNEPSWQRLYEQRMNGGLTQHKERIETRKNQVVDNHELQEVKAELKCLFTSANLNWNTVIDESFSQQENAVLSISVKFAPIESLANNIQTHIAPLCQNTDNQEKGGNHTGITDSEQEYLDIVKNCLEDGEIGSRERKLLDKIRIKNGISEERAKELVSTLTVTQLTNDEKEYLEMFHEYAEKGEITERERRRLDKFAQALGLTKKRIEELESN